MGFSLSVLADFLGVGQFLRQRLLSSGSSHSPSWRFFSSRLMVIVAPGIFGKEIGVRRTKNMEDTERAALLADN